MKEQEKDEATNAHAQAVALEYKSADELPSVLAHGKGTLARHIIELARAHNIPIQRDEVVANLLSGIPGGKEISAESYWLVAEILSFLYHTDKEFKRGHTFIGELPGTVEGVKTVEEVKKEYK